VNEDRIIRDISVLISRVNRLERRFTDLENKLKPLFDYLKAKGLLVMVLILALQPVLAASQPGPGIVGVGIIPQGYQSPLQVQMFSLYYGQSYYVYNTSFGYLASLYLTKGNNKNVVLQYYTQQDGFKTVTLQLQGWETLSFATIYLAQINSEYCNVEFHSVQQIIVVPFIIPQNTKQVTIIQSENVNQSQIVQAVLQQLDLSKYATKEDLSQLQLDHGSLTEQQVRQIAQAEAQRLWPSWKSEVEQDILETVQKLVEEQTSSQSLLNNPMLQQADPKMVFLIQMLTARNEEQRQQALAQYLVYQQQQRARRNMIIAVVLVAIVVVIIVVMLWLTKRQRARPFQLGS